MCVTSYSVQQKLNSFFPPLFTFVVNLFLLNLFVFHIIENEKEQVKDTLRKTQNEDVFRQVVFESNI